MALIYAKCNQCTAIMESRNAFGGDGGGVISMSGASIGSCECGGNFIVLGDEYVFNNDVASMTRGSIEDRELLARLLQVVRDSVAAGEAPERTLERAAAIDPRFLRFKHFALAAVVAMGGLLEFANQINTAFDLYNTLTGNKAKEEYSQQVKSSKEGSRQALEEFFATKEYQDFKRRLDAEESTPPPSNRATGNTGLKLHQVHVEFPITARKLAEYEKQRREIH